MAFGVWVQQFRTQTNQNASSVVMNRTAVGTKMLREFEAVLPRHPKHGGGPGIASAGEKKKGGRGKAINLTSVEGSTRMKQEYLGRKLLTHKKRAQ